VVIGVVVRAGGIHDRVADVDFLNPGARIFGQSGFVGPLAPYSHRARQGCRTRGKAPTSANGAPSCSFQPSLSNEAPEELRLSLLAV
jgi:hypothetical protein